VIGVFLSPYPFRGSRAPYLWVFYKLLASIDEPMAFILSEDYLANPESPLLAGRSELEERRQKEVNYGIPDAETFARHHFAFMDDALMHELLPQYGGNPLAFFKAFLSEEVEEVKQAIHSRLDQLPPDIELIISWSNCPSLAAVAGERGIPVAYLEVGPLRQPQYRSTAYFDFSGVNGNTEAKARQQAANGFPNVDFSLDELRDAFAMHPDDGMRTGNLVGVALQVEDDSNLVCFNNGYDNISLIGKALLEVPADRLLIRSHPGSRFDIKPNGALRDTSPTAIEFLKSCKRLMCINSSIGLEAALLGVPVQVLGDASYKFVVDEKIPAARNQKLAFYLFGYLVPFDLVFSAAYIRFRLKRPSEPEIFKKHMQAYGISLASGEAGGADIRESVACMREILRVAAETAVPQPSSSAPRYGVSKLYYRARSENFTEELHLEAVNYLEDDGSFRVRFVLPEGQRPDFVRFNPPEIPGAHVLSALRWGWSDNRAAFALAPLFDMPVRLVASSASHYFERGSLLLLAENGYAFFELSVNDLWSSVSASIDGTGVLEFSFSYQSMQTEMVCAILRLRELSHRTEETAVERGKHLEERFSDFERTQIGLAESIASGIQRLNSLGLAQDRLALNQGEQVKRVDKRFADFENTQIGLAESIAGGSQRLASLAFAQDKLALNQSDQAKLLEEIVAILNALQRAQNTMVEVQTQHSRHLHEAIRGLEEIRRISLMSWWKKRKARPANWSKP
jgi:hypothetical protein